MRRLPLLVFVLLAPVAARAQGVLDPAAPPRHGVLRLQSGFLPDPTLREVEAGGPDSASVGGCRGFVAGAAPALVLRYRAGRFGLTLSATPKDTEAETDLLLVVRTPDGQWLCDDDAGGDLRPRVVIRKPRSGPYAVWVAAYEPGAPVRARMAVSEIGHTAGD